MRISDCSSDVCSSGLGALTVTGRADDPKVEGAIELRRGRFDGVGRSFAFERGRVVFDGGPASDPTLDMILATEVAEIAAKVVVSGPAQSPKITLTSEPTLPEEEILSRILFGSPRAQLSPIGRASCRERVCQYV